MMRRREFITLLAAAAMWPIPARAQEPAVSVVGFLCVRRSSSSSAWTRSGPDWLRIFNRPGGNVTGVTFTTADVILKRLSQLHELAPKAELIGVLLDPNTMEVGIQLREAE